jgi:hypothetical protein
MHWQLLKGGRNIDVWLYMVYWRYGTRWALLAAALPCAGILVSIILMGKLFRVPRKSPPPPEPTAVS